MSLAILVMIVVQGVRIRCSQAEQHDGQHVSRVRRDGPEPAGQRHRQLPDQGHDRPRTLHEDLIAPAGSVLSVDHGLVCRF